MSDHRIIPIDRGLVSCSCGQWRQYVAQCLEQDDWDHARMYVGSATIWLRGAVKA
jgi:hypothetical protein